MSHFGIVGWTTHASIPRMLNNAVARAIKGSFKAAASTTEQTNWGGGTRGNEGTGSVEIHKHSCHCISPRCSRHVERVKAAVATESQGRAAEPGGMLRNVTGSINQAGPRVCKTLEIWWHFGLGDGKYFQNDTHSLDMLQPFTS